MSSVLLTDRSKQQQNTTSKASPTVQPKTQGKPPKSSSPNRPKEQQKITSKESPPDLPAEQQKTKKKKKKRNNTNKQSTRLERRYGYFHCKECNRHWESSHVYTVPDTMKVVFKQYCKKCRNPYYPYRNKALVCQYCGEEECVCPNPVARHVDPKKPHPAELCAKCLAGYRCV